jgi:hypothetical protein
MERRRIRTSSSFWAQPAGWSVTQVLPWICLLVVVATTAFGLQLAAASMLPSPAADQLDGSGHDIREQRAAFLQAWPMSSTRMVLITGQDSATGDRMQVECLTTTDRYAEDALLLELKDLLHVVAQLCNGATASAVRS